MKAQKKDLIIKKIEIENIGEVCIQKSKRSKNFRITLKAGSPVKVSIPYRLNFSDGERFVRTKINWVKRHLEAITISKNKETIFNEETDFHTKKRTFKLIYSTHDKIRIRITKDHILAECPQNVDLKNTSTQNFLKKGVVEAMRFEAKEILPERVNILAEQFGFTYGKISVKNAKTRWGSCSASNNINLNLHLIRLPDELIDYIIIHELVHTQHKNHGKFFWKKLEEIIKNSKEKSAALKRYSIDIF